MIVDNLKVHYAYIVKDRLNENKNSIELFFLSSYSLELYPDEYLNCDVKANANLSRMPRNKKELKNNLFNHMKMLYRTPERIKKYFDIRK